MPLAVVTGPGKLAGTAVADHLESAGWTVVTDPPHDTEIAALIYDPGLLDGSRAGGTADDFLDTVERLRPRLRPRAAGGSRIVVVGSRDGLGWPSRAQSAAAAAALAAAARSLALQLGPAGTTVNVIAALPPDTSPLRDTPPPAGTHLREPAELTPQPVTVDDIAATVAFFLHDRSGYLTGQVLYCCGGASMLSSLSV
ncbi:SDR family oxidoreductase [Amycolatopsis thermoflava]|uniref:SDR family oxidoreductase n=1 Tax=Amycolatopsis thermoflava TaxID=84480 RepID=UPI003EB8D9F1